MAKYGLWESFVNSGDDLLDCKPFDFHIEKGVLYFYLECDGIRYFCSGSHCYVSDIYFDCNIEIKHQCDFDSFWMFEVDNQSNEICNW